MFNRIKLPLVVFALLGAQWSFAQIDLKDLRAKPDTNFVEQSKSPVDKINQVIIPIPKLGLEVDYWKHWTKFGVNLNQASFSSNWVGGGVNSMAILGTAWHKSEYNKNNLQFTTEVDLRYGKVQNEGQLAKKNNDRIFWDNKLAYKLSRSWALYFSFTFESQFDVGNTYGRDSLDREFIIGRESNFMAPGYFTESFGLEYKPDNTFSLRLGTGTARQTLVRDSEVTRRLPEKYGMTAGQTFRNDLAFQITANLDRNLSKNLNIKARYNLFADYKELEDPDHRLDAVLTAKVSNLVNVSLTGIMVYNSAEVARVQYSQALALGLTYSLPR